MCSSGIRIEAWDYLKWKHITPLYSDQDGKQVIIAAKIVVYAGTPDKYYSFLTPESYYSLKEWMDFRAANGEKITDESWVMLDLWRTTNVKHGANRSLATNPRQLKASAIKKLLQRALWAQNLRPVLPKGERRHEWKTAHGFRKFFKSRAEQVMRPLYVELLMGHSVGVSDSYARPTEQEMLQDYIRALNQLSINTEQRAAAHQLQKQVLELREQREQSNYIILGRLAEKDKQIEELKASVDKLIKTEVNMARVNDWMNENMPEKIEQLIWEYMSPDPEDNSLPCDAQKFET